MKLVIVESPTKARKLKSYLGKDFQIEASVGHVRDLPKGKLGVDLEHNFKPVYEVSKDKKKVITKLKKSAKKADSVYLAMDPDREGEAIAWHVKHILSHAKGLKKLEFKRSVFHEITKPAVLNSIENPGKINDDLVDAQQARRVLDRLVGYKVSPVLWKKIRRGLSAGRVQSVALRLIVEKEREIEAFKKEEYWEIDVALKLADFKTQLKKIFKKDGKPKDKLANEILIVSLDKVDKKKLTRDSKSAITSQKQADPIVKDLADSAYKVSDVKKKQRKRYSRPPFTTSTLQQAAANRLGYSAKKTMVIAQQLYEEGLITYHRTDSFNLSSTSLKMAREFIKTNYSEKYLPQKPRVFARKSKNAQEAHEAIRVTDVKVVADQVSSKAKRFNTSHVKLYELIWKRFVASQMSEAVYDHTKVKVQAKGKKHKYLLSTTGSIMKFDGWMKLYRQSADRILPELEENTDLDYLDISPSQKFTQPPARYNDASLVKTLEKKDIGRPSTYASIISVIQTRGYVERVDKRFKPTVIGNTVNDFLVKHFDEMMDYDFTAEIEEDLDKVSRGEKEWQKVVKTFWSPLGKKIDNTEENAKRVQIPVEKTGKKCPECGKEHGGEIVIRTGKYGKFKSCSRFPDCKYTENIIEKINMKCPLCKKGEVITRNTRWGKKFFGCSRYPDCDWASWKKPDKDFTITKKEWEKIKKARAERKKKRSKNKKYKKKSKKKK